MCTVGVVAGGAGSVGVPVEGSGFLIVVVMVDVVGSAGWEVVEVAVVGLSACEVGLVAVVVVQWCDGLVLLPDCSQTLALFLKFVVPPQISASMFRSS